MQHENERADVAALRREMVAAAGEALTHTGAPTQAMARLAASLRAEAERRGFSAEAIRHEVTNRSIGDVDLRRVVEHDATQDFRTLADELGIALPGEDVQGVIASGARYLELRARMEGLERDLLASGWDLHMYDLGGVGNPILRSWLSATQAAEWGIATPPEQILLSLGSIDGITKTLLGLRATRWAGDRVTILFPTPCFGVPEWQARTMGMETVRLPTTPDTHYTLTGEQLRAALCKHPQARAVYLMISNNPTAFAFTPEGLRDVLAVLAEHPDVLLLLDLAYTGTGDPAAEQARMATIARDADPKQIIAFWSYSKIYSLTGDRFGWVAVGDPTLARQLAVAWANTIAALPAEWQLRFMAYHEMLHAHPGIAARLAALYQLRRRALTVQLAEIQAEQHLFRRITLDDDGTIYHWSTLQPGETAFSLFAATGIAGVSGAAYGYSDDHVRLSIGIAPVPGWERIIGQ